MKKFLNHFKRRSEGGDLRAPRQEKESGRLGRTSSKIIDVSGSGHGSVDNGRRNQIPPNRDPDAVQTYSGFDDWLSNFKPAAPVASELSGETNPLELPSREVPQETEAIGYSNHGESH